MQRHAAFAIPLHAGDFRAAQTAGAVDADALRAQTHRRLNGALHGAAEGHAALQLLSDVVGNELGVDFRFADFDDVQMDFARRVFRKIGLQFLDIGAFFADYHTRTRRMDGDAALLVRP